MLILELFGVGGAQVQYPLTIYHTPTAKKISKYQQKEVLQYHNIYIFMLTFVRN